MRKTAGFDNGEFLGYASVLAVELNDCQNVDYRKTGENTESDYF